MFWFHWLFLVLAMLGCSGIAGTKKDQRDADLIVFFGLVLIFILPVILGFVTLWKTLSI